MSRKAMVWSARTRANLWICAGLNSSGMPVYPCPGAGLVSNALISDQISLAEGICIQIHIARDAANPACGAHLPVGPVAIAAAGYPGIAAIAIAPGMAGVEILAIVIGDPGGKVDTTRLVVLDQVASAGAGTAIDDRMHEVGGLGLDVIGPIVKPGRVVGRAVRAAEFLEINHRIQGFLVLDDFAARKIPEVIRLRGGIGLAGAGEMISAHVNAGIFAVAHVAVVIAILVVG